MTHTETKVANVLFVLIVAALTACHADTVKPAKEATPANQFVSDPDVAAKDAWVQGTIAWQRAASDYNEAVELRSAGDTRRARDLFQAFLDGAKTAKALKPNPEWETKIPEATKAIAAINADFAKKKQASDKEERQFAASKAGRICKKYRTWSRNDCTRVASKDRWIGMDYDMLVAEYGKPNSVNPSNYGNGWQYQYCWHDRYWFCAYDHNGDGKIDSFN